MIQFEVWDISFKLAERRKLKSWILNTFLKEGKTLDQLTYIFTHDAHLNGINVEFLDHDTFTDIITFDHSDDQQKIDGEIYISIERVKENSTQLGILFHEELLRVMIHGVLHLCGYGDKSPEQESLMRLKENDAIQIFREMI